jgi:hypothetical protein
MPFASEKQRKFMHARHPKIAERWENEQEAAGISNEDLPEKVTDSKPSETRKKADAETAKNRRKRLKKKAFDMGLSEALSGGVA